MVYRIYVEKKPELAFEAKALMGEIRDILNIPSVTGVRVINRYDADNLDRALFEHSVWTVFAEPQTDFASETFDAGDGIVFAVEYLPGQFDQRADSAAQCIQIISQGEKPRVRSAKVFVLEGDPSAEELDRIKKHLINPVEAREASLELPETLAEKFDTQETVETLHGFTTLDHEGLKAFVKQYGLAMDVDDITVCRDYFASEHRDPTITEIRMIDTYWSDHCRHTTFLTVIDGAKFEDELLQSAYEDYLATRQALGVKKPVCLMDIATVAVKYLKKQGRLNNNVVVGTVISNLGLFKALDAAGIDYIRTGVGEPLVSKAMKDSGCLIGGEQCGHMVFSEYSNTGDGMITAMKMLDVMVQTHRSLGELAGELTIYPQITESIRVRDKIAAMADEDFLKTINEVSDILGDTGRVLVRKSDTESLVRIMVEAQTEQACKLYVDRMAEVLFRKGYAVQ